MTSIKAHKQKRGRAALVAVAAAAALAMSAGVAAAAGANAPAKAAPAHLVADTTASGPHTDKPTVRVYAADGTLLLSTGL